MHPTRPVPVFVDRSGTRGRWWTVFGAFSGALLSLATVVLLAGVLGGGTGHLPGFPVPAPDGGRAAGSAPATEPSPATSSRPPRRGSTPGPQVPATATGPASPSPAGPVPTGTPGPPGHGNPHASQSKKK